MIFSRSWMVWIHHTSAVIFDVDFEMNSSLLNEQPLIAERYFTMWGWFHNCFCLLCQTSNISRISVANKIVDHSDVVGASPVGAAPTTSSFSTYHLASMDWAKTTARRDENILVLGFGATYFRGLMVHELVECINAVITYTVTQGLIWVMKGCSKILSLIRIILWLLCVKTVMILHGMCNI